jgi:hypothetical protein
MLRNIVWNRRTLAGLLIAMAALAVDEPPWKIQHR